MPRFERIKTERLRQVNAEHDTLDKLVQKLEDVTAAMPEGHLSYTFDRPPQHLQQRLSMDFRQHVYFLFKEALHNVVKHAKASRVSVAVEIRQGTLTVRIQDNGLGFEEARVRAGNGLGLMRGRAANLGGELEITSRPGVGTCVVLTAPI